MPLRPTGKPRRSGFKTPNNRDISSSVKVLSQGGYGQPAKLLNRSGSSRDFAFSGSKLVLDRINGFG